MAEIDFAAVKQSVRIFDVISQYVKLKPAGAGLQKGLCPFHDESTPSFSVYTNSNQNRWCCFGCDPKGGDVFDFIERIHSVGKIEAVKRVAEMIGMSEGEYKKDGTTGQPRPAQTRGSVTTIPRREARPDPNAIAVHAKAKEDKAPGTQYGDMVQIETYDYLDEQGKKRYEVIRYHKYPVGVSPEQSLRDESYKKVFRQRWQHPDGNWVWGISAGKYIKRGDWYKFDEGKDDESKAVEFPAIERLLWLLPDVMAAHTVWIFEGEKDAKNFNERCREEGVIGTTASGGSQAGWPEHCNRYLEGKIVIVCRDKDAEDKRNKTTGLTPGEKYAQKIETTVKSLASEFYQTTAPEGFKDVSRYFQQTGKGFDDLDLYLRSQIRELTLAKYEKLGLISTEEILDRFEGGPNAFLNVRLRPKGLQTGFHKLDKMTGGLHGGKFFVIAGRPAMGKSTLAVNIGTHVAMRNYVALMEGRPDEGAVLMFSLEMGEDEILQRQVCSIANIKQTRFRDGYCKPAELDLFTNALQKLSESDSFFIDDKAGVTMEYIRDKVATFKRERGRKIALVITDYLQLIQGKGRSGENRTQEMSGVSREHKLLAKDERIPVLALSQLSRAPDQRQGDHRPILADLRESGSIEQDADAVGFVFREEIYRPDKEELRGKAELILAKQRNGPIGTAILEFEGAYNRFSNPPVGKWSDEREYKEPEA